jgi:benzoyl-CoA 2,3-dioxygenase component A
VSAATSLPVLARQHLIDPEVCIRCNTCQESCKKDAISHDRVSYAVDFDKCDACGDFAAPCPTGAIGSAAARRSRWPSSSAGAPPGRRAARRRARQALPASVVELVRTATSAKRAGATLVGHHPYVGLYGPQRPAVSRRRQPEATDASSDVDIRHLCSTSADAFSAGRAIIGILGGGSEGRPHTMRLTGREPRDARAQQPRADREAGHDRPQVAPCAGRLGFLCNLQRATPCAWQARTARAS